MDDDQKIWMALGIAVGGILLAGFMFYALFVHGQNP